MGISTYLLRICKILFSELVDIFVTIYSGVRNEREGMGINGGVHNIFYLANE